MPQINYNLPNVEKMLREHGEKAAQEERERIFGLIDEEIEDWKRGKWWQDRTEGAIQALTLLRKLITEAQE